MADLSAYTCTPRQIREYVIDCIKAGLVPFVRSSPGMGKSAIINAIAREFGLKVIDLRLSQATPEDAQGLPRFRDITDDAGTVLRSISEFVPFETFPVESTPIPAGFNGWLLFLDEFNSGTKMVQAAMYKIILDKMVGQDKLHPNVAIVCAGNLEGDRAIVNSLSTAMQSRLVHLIMRLDHEQFMKDVAFKNHWDPRIIAYLSYKQGALHDFQPDHDGHTFSCPRTWEFMNKLISGNEVTEDKAALYAGTITSGTAVEFITFTKVFNELPSLKEIIQDPEGVPVPTDPATRFATVSMLISQVTDDTHDKEGKLTKKGNFEPITIFVNRWTSELRVLFFRGLLVQQPELRKHPMFRKALLELSKYLHDDEDTDAEARRAA